MQTFKNNKEEDWKTFRTLAELQALTEQEKRGIEVEFDIFERMTPPDPVPEKRHAVYHAMDLNFRLSAHSKAVDAGERLPTINNGFRAWVPILAH